MKIKTQAKYELISGLHRNLKLAVSCVYAISCNVNTHDGLINGAIYTLKYVEYINQQTTIRPSILWVHFSDTNVGTQQRKRSIWDVLSETELKLSSKLTSFCSQTWLLLLVCLGKCFTLRYSQKCCSLQF